MARDGKIRAGALVDLKGISEASGATEREGEIRFGANLRLTEVVESAPWSLLSLAAGGIADRTVRNSVTLGGNICGHLPYREAVLPFLLTDTVAEVAGPDGIREAPLRELFDKRIRLGEGEFLLALRVPSEVTEFPAAYRRRTKDSRMDYPLVTLAALKSPEGVRLSVAGAFSAPRRISEVEGALGEGATPQEAVAKIGVSCKSDFRGSGEYRRALLELSVAEVVEELHGGRER